MAIEQLSAKIDTREAVAIALQQEIQKAREGAISTRTFVLGVVGIIVSIAIVVFTQANLPVH